MSEGRNEEQVFLYSNPNINYRGGYYNEDGELVIPEMNFEPPWYICSYGHITQTFNSESVTSSRVTCPPTLLSVISFVMLR